jgi:hypothetical protein
VQGNQTAPRDPSERYGFPPLLLHQDAIVNSVWVLTCLLADIWTMKLFVWMLGRKGELLDSHLFFFDKYSELADYHRLKNQTAKADRLAAIAEAHYQAAPDDEPPDAAAMAMPVPQPPVKTNAIGTRHATKPSAGRRSEVVPSPTS